MKTLVEMERMVNTELGRPAGQGFKLDNVTQVRMILFQVRARAAPQCTSSNQLCASPASP